MDVAALLLTGGSSRRMGRDKATLEGPDGVRLAPRTFALLAAVADPVLEVGPGHGGSPSVADDGAGPLAAVATGVEALAVAGWCGAVLVVATDLPALEEGMVAWLAAHPAPGTVIPVVDGRRQLLCARYDQRTLRCSAGLVGRGHRRMADLVDGRPVHLAGPGEWGAVSSADAWRDVDTPADLRAARARWRRLTEATTAGP